MSTQLKLRRGTTAQHSTFTGANGEITIDTDKKTVVVHDGTTAGGRALPQFDSSGNLSVGMTAADAYTRIQASGAIGSYYGAGTVRTTLYSANGYALVGTTTNHSLQLITNDTTRATIDTSGNLGIGVTPSAWEAGGKLQVSAGQTIGSVGNGLVIASNWYYNAGDKFAGTGYASYYNQQSGTHSWATSTASGTVGGAATMTQAMRLDSSGNLLVGTTTQQGGVSARMVLNAPTGSVNGALTTRVDTTSATTHIFFQNPNNTVGSVSTSGSSTTFATSSDYRLKEDYQPVADAIVRLNQLKPVNFAWKVDGSRCDGFLAHELQEVIPEAATGHKDEMRIEEYEITPKVEATFDEEGNELTPAVEAVMGEREVPVYQGIDQSKIVPLLTAALQEAVAKIESLTQRIEALEYTKQGE